MNLRACIPAAAGAGASLSLWAWDLWSLSRLTYAGVSDAATQARLLEVAGPAITALESRLFVLHAVFGAGVGLLGGAAWGYFPRARRSIARSGLLAAAATLTIHLLALLGMVARYPQLYADQGWLGGGVLAAIQRLVTHHLGPRPFDGLLVGGVLLLIGLALRRHAAPWWRRTAARRPAAAVIVTMMLLLGAGWAGAPSAASAPPDRGPNLLILAADSLRTDRLESAEVMPQVASLVPRGALFRHAFTPIARTFQSWVSTLTGTEPRRHGVRTMFPSREARRDIGATLFSELRDRGWRTFVVSDFAGDVFPRFPGGFETVAAPDETVDTVAQAAVLSAHRWSLPALRLGPLRRWLPAWKSLANLSDPEWLADEAAGQIGASDGRPFAGLVFFGTSHFPYAPPYPDYLWRAGDYRGPFLYHAPPQRGDGTLTPADEEQVRARYDGALRAVDRAIGRLLRQLGERELLAHTVVVITSDHGEELYEDDGIAGHGDVVGGPRSQAVPVLILGPGAPAGLRSSAQVRLYDLAPTLLELLVPGPRPRRFGDGVSLLSAPDEPRPICVETGLWFWPDLPRGLRGRRLSYPGIADLLELDGPTREMVVRRDRETLVETAKARGLVLGNRLRVEQLLPGGRTVTERELPEIAPAAPAGADLAALFEERCLAGDPRLERYLGSVVWRPEAAAPASANVAPLPHHPAEIQ